MLKIVDISSLPHMTFLELGGWVFECHDDVWCANLSMDSTLNLSTFYIGAFK